MFKRIFKGYRLRDLLKDIPAGIIVALVSIPISMGYAQVSGLPPVYGLYGSILPILFFGLMTSSPRFVFGIDAAPAALTGSLVYSLGITFGSAEAVKVIPAITLVVAGWLFLFAFLRAGRFVRFISAPVMGGFISGIGCTIILMQVPKLFGGTSGRGEVTELLPHIWSELLRCFNPLSLFLGILTIVIITVCRKHIPKVPMSLVMMLFGAALTFFFHIDKFGVQLLPSVAPGLPGFIFPDLTTLKGHVVTVLTSSLSVALVIVAETLLSTNNYALKHGDHINNEREIFAYATANLVSAFSGSCPANGSVSRTSIADQFGVHSQLMSIVASLSMVGILLYGTAFIGYLPVPVLTGIVIAALMGILEFDLARELQSVDRVEWLIFYVVFFTVLFLGTIYGVLAGVVLSFVTVVIRASVPPRDFLGCIENNDGFYALSRMKEARPIEHTLIYRFTGALFFANIGQFQEDLEKAVTEDTKQIIIDASGIGSIDVTAAERLLLLYQNLQKRGIRFFLTEHVGAINDQLRTFGASQLILDGAVKPTISSALRSIGMERPYPLAAEWTASADAVPATQQAEFEWAYGRDADIKMEKMAEQFALQIADSDQLDTERLREAERTSSGGYWNRLDEDEFLDLLEMQLAIILSHREEGARRIESIDEKIIARHLHLEQKLAEKDADAISRIMEHRARKDAYLKEHHPEAYALLQKERSRYSEVLAREYPELAEKILRIHEHKS